MIHTLVLGLVALPLLSALLLSAFGRRFSAEVVQRLLLLTVALVMLCALALFPFLDSQAAHDAGDLFAIVWLPGSGRMGLHLGSSGLTMALVTAASLFLMQLIFDEEQAASRGALFSAPLMLVALAAANAAFLSSNFLGRYVALEVVGLCIALAPLLELPQGMRVTRSVYMALRVGDAGFLAAILLLMQATGTLDIAAALAAGEALSAAQLAWPVGGFLLAVWVKVGAWPLHGWIYAGRLLRPTTRGWLYGILMPNLGLYLLYRVTPLLRVAGPLRDVLFGVGVLAVLVALWLAFSQRRDAGRLFPALGALGGGLALCFAARGAAAPVWWLAVAFAPLQVVGNFVAKKLAAKFSRFLAADSILPSAQLLPIARQLQHRVEVGMLGRLVLGVPQAVLAASRWLYRVVEHGTLEGGLRASSRAVLGMGRWLQRWHTGSLRDNLAWVVVMLLVVMLIIVGGG